MTKPVSGEASIGAQRDAADATSSAGAASAEQTPALFVPTPPAAVHSVFQSLQSVRSAPKHAVIQPAVRGENTPRSVDLLALRAAREHVRKLGVHFYQRQYGWIATNGADPDDVGQSDTYLQIEVASDASARGSEAFLSGQLSVPVEILLIQRGDAPRGTGYRLLAALLYNARIIPTKISGVIDESTTRSLMREAPEEFAAKIADSPIVRMRTKALMCMGLRPERTVLERDERGVEVLVTYVDQFSIRRRWAARRSW